MPAACKNLRVPRTSLMPEAPRPRRRESMEELRTALDIIVAAAANLRHYRERLTAEEHAETVRDIEQAAEWIATELGVGEPTTMSATGRQR